ncbi:MAG TPA: MarR family transcriptional regulator [Paraburkholderia sp.]|nr:MarR family transcriptional regulator [Paraburkholderia sp.]
MNKSTHARKSAAADPKPSPKGVSQPAENVVDLEMSTGADSHMGLRLWLRMLTATNLVQAELRKRLRTEFDTTLPRFDLMAQLERHPEGLKMTELSRRLMVTGGNVTGITDGLEREGLVVREVDAADRRVYRVKLTTEGQQQFRRMAAEHERWVVDLFGPLSPRQKRQLIDLLGGLKEQLG